MKKPLLVLLFVVAGCVESPPDASSPTTNVEEPVDLYDCSDCVFEGFSYGNSTVNGRLPDRARCEGPAPNATPFAVSLGVWTRGEEVAAAGIRCVDYTATWENDAFFVGSGNNVRDLLVVGNVPFMIDAAESRCAEGLLSGVEYQTRGESVVALKALCAEYRIEVQDDEGVLSPRVRRLGVEPGDYVPDVTCDDCDIKQEICPEGSIAEGLQTKLQELDRGATVFAGFEVVCVPITPQIAQP